MKKVWNVDRKEFVDFKENKVVSLLDFVIESPAGRDLKILQLSDPQIIDAGQIRFFERLNPIEKAYWATENDEKRCYGYLKEIIGETKPDIIIITGDLVYGEFDDNGSVLKKFVKFMDGYKIPWLPVFGNHDNETILGVEWQTEMLENAEYCLFKKGSVSGNGNYTVGITENGELKRVFVMLDTHGCKCVMGLYDDQVEWYTEKLENIKAAYPDVKISFVMHVQPMIFEKAFSKYGFINQGMAENSIETINIDAFPDKPDTDFGLLGADLKNPWDGDFKIWQGMKALGMDSMFVSHQHSNSGSVIYDGVRCQFGQKSSTYDRANYITPENKIVHSYTCAGEPIVGGTVFTVRKASGDITDAHIYLCKEAGGNSPLLKPKK